MWHRTFGCIVAIVTTIAAVKVYRAAPSWRGLRRLCVIAPILVAAQITLGIFVVLSLRAVPLAVGHFAGAASLWALWMSAWLMTGRRQKKTAIDGELVAL
jgi:heme A synthase